MKKILARTPLTYLVRVNPSNSKGIGFERLLNLRLQRFQFNSQESWVKVGCSHCGNTVWVALFDTFCKSRSHGAKMLSHPD